MLKFIGKYFKQLKSVSREVASKSEKSNFFVITDIVYSGLLYGASPNNYLNFEFYNLNRIERKTYVTHKLSKQIIKKYNNKKFIDIFEDKTKFALKFDSYFKRDWISTRNMKFDNFQSFIVGKDKIIYKPIDSDQGQGIEVIDIFRFKDINVTYDYITSKSENGIIEAFLVQHKDMSDLYSESVNIIRAITLFKNYKCNLLVANLTVGNGGKIANASMSDLVALIDVNKGTVSTHFSSLKNEEFKTHPKSGSAIKGFKIPYWREIIDMLNEISAVVPEVGYVGWDIAITPEGPIVIEGNTNPGYKFFQLPKLLEDNIGQKKIYNKHI